MNYYFSDFTEFNYEKILIDALKRYNFILFSDIKDYRDKKEFILLRHDIDFSVNRAYALAKIENKLNIKSTYFLLLSSNFYNVFEKEIRDLILKIIKLNHRIGLHFDFNLYNIKNKSEFERYLIFERDVLSNLFNIKIEVFSLHNPNSNFIYEFSDFKYSDMINVYSKYILDNFIYCSDSNGYWRYERLLNFLNKPFKANRHILLHPVWWQKKVLSPYLRIRRSILGRCKSNINYYNYVLKKTGRINVK